MADPFPESVVHTAADDVRRAIETRAGGLKAWAGLTPLGRNEFLCWIEDAKQARTRAKRIGRMLEDLEAGKKRPCCWAGCIHRTDKAPGPWQQAVLVEGKKG